MSDKEQLEKLDKSFLGQPKGLATLFFTEMLERFSYYGMRAILMYYIYDTVANGGLGLPQSNCLSHHVHLWINGFHVQYHWRLGL